MISVAHLWSDPVEPKWDFYERPVNTAVFINLHDDVM